MRYLFIIFFLISCGEPLTKDNESYIIKNESQEDVIWICHNEDSEHHQKRCHTDCLIPGDQTAFCWILDKEDCPNNLHLEACQD